MTAHAPTVAFAGIDCLDIDGPIAPAQDATDVGARGRPSC
jgi:hypothetical protein